MSSSRENISIIELEGKAIIGLIVDVELEDCSNPSGWKKIIARDRNGTMYETKCIEPQAAKRNFLVISSYASRWSNLIVENK
ncbi:MAG: hypothetical protein QXO93_05640 [Acidilobaceae archaeon]